MFDNTSQAIYSPANKLRNSSTSLSIRKITLVGTKPQQNQYLRTYVPKVDSNTTRVMDDYINRIGQPRLNSTDIANMQIEGANFFEISSQPVAPVNIVNGWETIRFKFTITVDIYFNGTMFCTEYISGYTDYYGVTNNMVLDPKMLFVINSITRSSPRPIKGHYSTVPGQVVTNSNYVISKNALDGFGRPTDIRLTRPSDVFSELSVSLHRQGALEWTGLTNSLLPNTSYLNLNTTVGATPVLSDTSNNIPSAYAAKILDAHGKVFSESDDNTNLYSAARSIVQEQTYGSSYFLKLLDEKSTNYGNVVGNTFTLDTMYAVDPALQSHSDDRIVVFTSDSFLREMVTTPNGTIAVPAGNLVDSFSGTGQDYVDALTILQSSISQMRKAGVNYITCHLTNYSGTDNKFITSLLGLDDGFLHMRAQNACDNIINDAVRVVTKDSASYSIDLTIDTDNDAYIKLAIGMNHPREYVLPCFALASISPIVSNDQRYLDNIVSGVKDITDYVFDKTITVGSPYADTDFAIASY